MIELLEIVNKESLKVGSRVLMVKLEPLEIGRQIEKLSHMRLGVADLRRFVFYSDLEKEVKASVLSKLHEEVFPLLPPGVATDALQSRERQDLTLLDVNHELFDLLFNKLTHLLIWYRLVEVDLIELYVWHALLFFNRKASVDTDCVFDLVKRHLFLGSWTLDEPWLVVQLVVNLGAVNDDITKHVVLEISIVVFLDIAHILDLSNHTHHAYVEELHIGIIDKVGRLQVTFAEDEN